jgi:hypothetical protein
MRAIVVASAAKTADETIVKAQSMNQRRAWKLVGATERSFSLDKAIPTACVGSSKFGRTTLVLGDFFRSS